MLFNIRHHLVDMAQFGISASRHHQAFTAAGTDRGPRKQQVRAIAERKIAAQRLGVFFHDRRLAGKNRLFHPQIVGFNNPQVGRDSVARTDHHNITRHQRGGRHRFMVPLADHHRFAGKHIANALQRFFRVTFLDMANQGINHRDAQNHQGIDPVPHHRSQQRGRQQDVNQDIVKMGQETEPCGLARLLGERILTVLLEPRGGFCAANTFGGTVGAGQGFIDGELVERASRFVCTHGYLLTPVTEIRTASGRP